MTHQRDEVAAAFAKHALLIETTSLSWERIEHERT